MTSSLRDRLLAPELAMARSVLASGGVEALVAAALALVREAGAAHARFSDLSLELAAASGAARRACVRRYLRETVSDPRKLRDDLHALRREGEHVLDRAALGERNARHVVALERRAEGLLATTASALGAAPAALDGRAVIELARTPGRWSRRTEALAVLRKLARSGLAPEHRQFALALTRELASPAEQRWVQAAALFAMAAIDVEQAHALARARLSADACKDDFIVRSMIVRVAARLR
jgi:hypothetical protein